MEIGRRRFFVELSAGVAAMSLPGCASVMVTRVAPSDGTVRLSLGEFAQLARPDGHLRIQVEGSPTPIDVLRLKDGEYAAISPICTHLGCTVDVQGAWLVCPCHGSTYERTGRVLRGPAERALPRYLVTATDDSLIIHIEENR